MNGPRASEGVGQIDFRNNPPNQQAQMQQQRAFLHSGQTQAPGPTPHRIPAGPAWEGRPIAEIQSIDDGYAVSTDKEARERLTEYYMLSVEKTPSQDGRYPGALSWEDVKVREKTGIPQRDLRQQVEELRRTRGPWIRRLEKLPPDAQQQIHKACETRQAVDPERDLFCHQIAGLEDITRRLSHGERDQYTSEPRRGRMHRSESTSYPSRTELHFKPSGKPVRYHRHEKVPKKERTGVYVYLARLPHESVDALQLLRARTSQQRNIQASSAFASQQNPPTQTPFGIRQPTQAQLNGASIHPGVPPQQHQQNTQKHPQAAGGNPAGRQQFAAVHPGAQGRALPGSGKPQVIHHPQQARQSLEHHGFVHGQTGPRAGGPGNGGIAINTNGHGGHLPPQQVRGQPMSPASSSNISVFSENSDEASSCSSPPGGYHPTRPYLKSGENGPALLFPNRSQPHHPFQPGGGQVPAYVPRTPHIPRLSHADLREMKEESRLLGYMQGENHGLRAQVNMLRENNNRERRLSDESRWRRSPTSLYEDGDEDGRYTPRRFSQAEAAVPRSVSFRHVNGTSPADMDSLAARASRMSVGGGEMDRRDRPEFRGSRDSFHSRDEEDCDDDSSSGYILDSGEPFMTRRRPSLERRRSVSTVYHGGGGNEPQYFPENPGIVPRVVLQHASRA